MVWPAVIGAIGAIGGGALQSMAQGQASDHAADAAANNIAMQREFAQTGVTWRARDVVRAAQETGIHPLSLLGVNPSSFSPVAQTFVPQTGWGEGLAAAGQNVSRAIMAGQDRDIRERALALQEAALNTQAERGVLENEILKVELASAKSRLLQSQMPGVPVMKPEKASMGFVKDEGYARRVNPNDPAHGPMQVPSVEFSRNSDGSYSPLRSKAATDRMEDDFWNTTKHFIVNSVLPMFNPGAFKPPFPPPVGQKWYVDFKGDWRLIRDASTLDMKRRMYVKP